MPSCLTVACGHADYCALSESGGCVPKRFGAPVAALVEPNDLREDAKALNGTEKRQVRDPRFMKRKRKALTP